MNEKEKEVLACLKKLLREELLAIVSDCENGLKLRFVGGEEFILKVEERMAQVA